MSLNFNVDPYFDDYNNTKQFYRILFKPGRAVQARELTQIQSILQNQISSFGDHIFQEGSVVSGGQHFLDDSAFFLKCQSTYSAGEVTSVVDFSDLEGKYIVEVGTGKIGFVKKLTDATLTDPVTLHVTVVQGQQTPFDNNSNFYVIDGKTSSTVINRFTSLSTDASGTSLLFHIAEGVFYAEKTFLYCAEDTIVIGKYSKVASAVVGLNIEETIVDSIDDSSLLDPALGASNYLAPGADRYKISLILSAKQYTDEASSNENFIELTRIKDGNLLSDKRVPIYSDIIDTIARRTYDTNGNYIVKNFIPKIQPDSQNDDKLILQISAGKGYVQGYEIETISPTSLSLNKARATESVDSYEINTFYGNYTYVNTLSGTLPTINTTYLVEIHNTTSAQSAATLIGTAYIRNLEYVSDIGTQVVYALFLDNIVLNNSDFSSARSFLVTDDGDYGSLTFSAIVDGSAIDDNQTQLYDSGYSELLFNVPQTYIETLNNVEYQYKQHFTGTISSNSVSISCKTSDSFLVSTSPTAYRQNYIIVNTTTGEFIPSDNITVTLASSHQASINFNTNAYNSQSINIIATVKTSNDTKKIKTLVSNFVPSAGNELTISNNASYTLLKSDVYALNYVYEFSNSLTYLGVWSSSTSYSEDDVIIHNNIAYISLADNNGNNNPSTSTSSWLAFENAVNYYSFDSGQTDSYYGHGSIQRKSKPNTQLKVVPIFDYFTHTGTGFISSESYPVPYSNIPLYESKTTGKIYSLRDTIDFRPRRTDDVTSIAFSTHQIPQAFNNVTASINYYLRRIDKAILTRTGQFKLLQGIPSYSNPKSPDNQTDAITLYVLSYKPYTDTVADIDMKIIPYRRYTMGDIANLDDRITRVEYYTSLNLLEKEVSVQTFLDNNGNTLFKNGFLVDSFKGHNVGDVSSPDYRCSIDYTNGICRPLYLSDCVEFTYQKSLSNTAISPTPESSLITVPYTESIFANQPVATNFMSVNPFSVVSFVGRLKLTPESDTWFDTSTAPDVVVNVDGQNDNYQNWSSIGTQWNAWQTIWTGENIVDTKTQTVMTSATSGYQVTRATVEVTQRQTRTGDETLKSPGGVVLGTSTNIVNQSVIPYARAYDIKFNVEGMSPNSQLYLYIDKVNMSNYLYSVSSSSTGVSAVTTNAAGSASGIIKFPNNTDVKFLAGKIRFVLCDNPFDFDLSTSYAQADFFSQGLFQRLQSTIISTKGNQQITRTISDNRVNVITQTRETSNTVITIDNTPNASYSLTSDFNTIRAGNNVTFIFTTQNAPPGKTYIATIGGTIANTAMNGGITKSNVSIVTTGSQASNKATFTIPTNSTAANSFVTFSVNVAADPDKPKLGGPLVFSSNVAVQAAVVIVVTPPVAGYTLSGPSTVNEGDRIEFQLSSSNVSSAVAQAWTLSNPGGAWLTETGTNTGIVKISGGNDFASYVDNYADLVILYQDGLSGLQIYGQSYPGKIWQNAADQYNSWLNKDAWRTQAEAGKAAFGKWHWDAYGKKENRILPVNSIISGNTNVSDSSPARITLYVNPEHKTTGDRVVTLSIAGQSKSVTIKDTALSLYPAVSPVTRKLVTKGDFVDSNLTISQALEQFTYITDGKSAAEINAQRGKICISSSQISKRNQYGALVASYYRDPAKLNRNPELAGFLFWVIFLFELQKSSTITSPAVYPISGVGGSPNSNSVWVNPGTDKLEGQTNTIYRNLVVNQTGTWTINVAADNFVRVFLNDNEIGSATGVDIKTFSFNPPVGNHVLKCVSQNYVHGGSFFTNPGWWSVVINSPSTPAYWRTGNTLAAENVSIPGTGKTEAQAIAEVENGFRLSTEYKAGVRTQFLACTTDPLAQTFFVPESVYPNGLFLTAISLYFRQKDETLPLFLEIRPTENGYPSSSEIVPLSTVWKKPYEVNVSNNASVETKFTFSDPVYLKPGEYAIVVGSNSNNYLAYFATVGATQIGTNNIVSTQPNVGSLFKSQNASTWTPDQTSDLSFKLYKSTFDTSGTFEAIFNTKSTVESFDYHSTQITSEEIDFNDKTDIVYFMKNQYNGTFDSEYTSIMSNKNIPLKSVKTNSSSGDTILKIDLSTKDSNISPVIDIERLSMIMVQNIINNESDVIIPETTNIGGTAAAKYVTRYVTLAEGFDATGLRVIFDINRQVGSSVKVYYKIRASSDSGNFDDKYWQELPIVQKPTMFSNNDQDFLIDEYLTQEVSYVDNGLIYNNFKTFAIKVVMFTNNPAIVPQIKNLRAIATS